MNVIFMKAASFFFLLLRYTWAFYHCDNKLNICLYTNGTNSVDGLEGARNKCVGNNSILLEIYNEEYQRVVDQAFREWGVFNGNYLWLNLRKDGDTFRWLSTGTTLNYTNLSPSIVGSARYACISFSNNVSSWQPYWSEEYQLAFICLQNSSQQSTSVIEKTANPDTTTPSQSHTNESSSIQQEDGTLKNALIGSFVALLLLMLVGGLLIFIWCFIKRRKRSSDGNKDCQIPPPPSSTPDSPNSIYYISEDHKRTLTVKSKKKTNDYVEDSLSHVIRYHKPPNVEVDPQSIYETIKSLYFNSINNYNGNNYYSGVDNDEEFNA